MAEQVQATLDQMVAPLKDLLDRGIFSQDEIRQIVARRRDSEYLLRRRVPRKADYLRYIEAELALEKLRDLRTKKVNLKNKKKKSDSQEQAFLGDAHVVKNLHFIFARMCRKFRDVALYMQYIEFCKEQKSFNRLGRLYAEALQLFPRNVGLWIEAASHDFFELQSVSNARILLQRGLRINESATEMWIQYFTMELHYIQKIRGRQSILAQSTTDDIDNGVPLLVYKSAIKSIPTDLDFRLSFIDACGPFPNTRDLEEYIVESIKNDFPREEQAWIARAMFALQGNATTDDQNDAEQSEEEEAPDKKRRRIDEKDDKKKESVLSILDEACDTLQTEDMYLQSIRMVKSISAQIGEAEAKDFVRRTFKKAEQSKTPAVVLEQVDYLLWSGEIQKAKQLMDDFVSSCPSKVVPELYIKWASLVEPEEGLKVLHKARNKIDMKDPGHMVILLHLLEALLQTGAAMSELEPVFSEILLLAPGYKPMKQMPFPNTVADACLSFLIHCIQVNGLEGARKVYRAVLYQSNYTKEETALKPIKTFLDECIRIESNKKHLRRLFDTAVELFRDTEYYDVFRQRRNDEVIYAP